MAWTLFHLEACGHMHHPSVTTGRRLSAGIRQRAKVIISAKIFVAIGCKSSLYPSWCRGWRRGRFRSCALCGHRFSDRVFFYSWGNWGKSWHFWRRHRYWQRISKTVWNRSSSSGELFPAILLLLYISAPDHCRALGQTWPELSAQSFCCRVG